MLCCTVIGFRTHTAGPMWTYLLVYVNLPAGLCELVLSLPYLVLLLFLFLCCCLCSCAVHRDLADILGVLAGVAMVSSPLVGRGYHSASMVGNQIDRVSLPGQRCQPINRSSFSPGPWNCRCGLPNETPKLVLHCMVRSRPPAPAPRKPKKGCRLPIAP
jgi:hypothetical protein